MVSLISLDRRRSYVWRREAEAPHKVHALGFCCVRSAGAGYSSDDPWSYRIWRPFLSRVAGFKMALLGAFVLYVDQSACGGRAWIDRILHLRRKLKLETELSGLVPRSR